MSPKKSAHKSASRPAATGQKVQKFTAEERAAMKDRVREAQGGAEGESAVLEKIAGMSEPDRSMGRRVHAIIRASAPELVPRLWYGMPAYARDDKVVCFFQGAAKFKTRYATLGFSDKARLDDGAMWPTGFALKELTSSEETRISALVRKAVS